MQGVEGDEAIRARRELEDPTMCVRRVVTSREELVLTVLIRLKLKVYRSLGIDIDPAGTGSYDRATIRNTQKGDVHVVNIDPKFSRFFYANYFWQTM